jgi:hypothetical protein
MPVTFWVYAGWGWIPQRRRVRCPRYPIDSDSPLFVNLDRAPLFGMLKPGTVYSTVTALHRCGIGTQGWTAQLLRDGRGSPRAERADILPVRAGNG